ncbi:MAG: S-methyl-5-thioribose-1-phosphate isomerase [Thermodesulfobacteriota bacterium]|nr:S-methyl-5-thioribose-1-phosphate isomerase [Thermodesulfobacteriota bacterium]
MTATDGKPMRPIWLAENGKAVQIIDQRVLPHELVIVDLTTVDDVIDAICDMMVRGAPLIGATGALGTYLAALNAPDGNDFSAGFQDACERLKQARPTAVNLVWAVDRVCAKALTKSVSEECRNAAKVEALAIVEEEAENCRKIGEYGSELIAAMSREKGGKPVNVLTHCNAGWLACIEYGTATAPIYKAFEDGIDVHVWVDETRPLNQGARLTAWELGRQGVKHTVITDNAGGHLMQHGMVDMVIVGTDRSTYTGDVANKIGTYLKALAAKDNDIPFYVALPSSTFDWELEDGVKQIPIEERDPDEVRFVQGKANGRTENVLIVPESSAAANYAFDVTPARLVTGFITERGICNADRDSVLGLFPDKK